MFKGIKETNSLKQGQKLYWEGDLPNARAILEEARQLNPCNIGVLLYLGIVLNNLGESSKAQELLAGLRKLEPENPAGLIFSGMLYYDEDNFEQAERYFKEALIHGPENPLAQAFLSLVNLRRNPQTGLAQMAKGELYPQPEFLARLLLALEQDHV